MKFTRSTRLLYVAVGLLLLMGAKKGRAENPPIRFSGQFADGTRFGSAFISDWNRPEAQPKINGRWLFDPAKPIRWLKRDAVDAPAAPRSFVEMVGGDVFPGRVSGFANSLYGGRESTPHLIVEADVSIDPDTDDHNFIRRSQVHLATRWVRRIVWSKRGGDEYLPGTAVLLDGRRLTYRSVRFTADGVLLLTETDKREILFAELAELHMPRMDAWDAYFEQLSLLATDPAARLLRIDTLDGLRITTSTQRFVPMGFKNAGDPQFWYHAVQPAWALEPLWLPYYRIASERCFALNEVPLSGLEPAHIGQRPSLGGTWRPLADFNVEGQPLKSAGQEFGWGWGVHAYSELTFDLPTCVRSFRARFGLDLAAGRGGCVRGLVYANRPEGEPLYQSKHLIGSGEVLDVGPLNLGGPAAGQKQLALVVDPANLDHPAGADPLDIRDFADWLEPLLELDPDKLQTELRTRRAKVAPGWSDWTIADSDLARLEWTLRWEQAAPGMGRFRLEARPLDPFVRVSKKVFVPEKAHWLLANIDRARDPKFATPSQVQVRINGRAVQEFEVPSATDLGEPAPMPVPVDAYHGREVQLEMVMMPSGDKGFVNWGAVTTSDSLPNLMEVFEDGPLDPAKWKLTGDTALTQTDKYSGVASLKVAPAETSAYLALPNVPIRVVPQLGEYRYLRFAWRKTKGDKISLLIHFRSLDDPRLPADRVIRLHAGKEPKPDPKVDRRVGEPIPNDWTIIEYRDLANDIGGPGYLTGVTLECPDGDAALFDHIYLARTPQDFERCPLSSPRMHSWPYGEANLIDLTIDPTHYSDILNKLTPLFTSSRFGNMGVALVKDVGNRNPVLRTDPAENQFCQMRAPIDVPAGKTTQLNLSLANLVGGTWKLSVVVNGQLLHDSVINKDISKNEYTDVTVDLSPFAGKKVIVELQNRAATGNPQGYWNKIEVVSK